MTKANVDSKYFQIDKGSTVLQSVNGEWFRWDIRDGVVPTSLWKADDPRLTEITREQAIALMK